jgi:hypothetical protein
MFTIDGIEWDVPCNIDRTAEMQASDISGMLLDKTYFNDVIGTYMKYDISLAIPMGYFDRYTDLFEILSNPVDAHTFVFPYNQTTIEITGRISVVSDRYYRKEGNVQIWRGTKFSVIANHPSKEMSLTEVISRGTTSIPDKVEVPDGTIYEWDAENGIWNMITLDDADEVYY